MTKAKKQLLRQSILVAVGLLGSSLLPAHAATSAAPTKKVYKIKQVSKDFLETQEPHWNLYANHHWYDLIASTLQRHSGNWRETSKTSRKASLIRLKLCQL